MHIVFDLGREAGARLKARREKIVVAETSSGGLICASLLAVPGASNYFLGGLVPYSFASIRSLAELSMDTLREQGIRSSSEPYAQLLAQTTLARHPGATWALSETGAAGPDGNRYGDPPGHTCMAVAGPLMRVRTLRTDRADRLDNMQAFAEASLRLLIEALDAAG